MSVEPKFIFGAREPRIKNDLIKMRRGEPVNLILASNQTILFATNTVILESPKFIQKVKIKDLSIDVTTSFAAGGEISLAKRRVDDTLVDIAGYSGLSSDQNGEASILLQPGESVVIYKSGGTATDTGNFDSNIDGEYA